MTIPSLPSIIRLIIPNPIQYSVGGEGLEPPVSKRTDLQSARLPITGYPPKWELTFPLYIYMLLTDYYCNSV